MWHRDGGRVRRGAHSLAGLRLIRENGLWCFTRTLLVLWRTLCVLSVVVTPHVEMLFDVCGTHRFTPCRHVEMVFHVCGTHR
jgi:hypothetical protein